MMSCPRHPLAAAHAGHCAACLIEGAFFEPEAAEGGRRRELTILIPLGGSPGSTVFLVREQGARGRLMRLKTWDRPAPPGFLTEFERLRTRLDGVARRRCRSAGGGGRRCRRSRVRAQRVPAGHADRRTGPHRTPRRWQGRRFSSRARRVHRRRRTPPDWFMARSAPATSCRTAAPHSSWTLA